jgi:hypothetical protein
LQKQPKKNLHLQIVKAAVREVVRAIAVAVVKAIAVKIVEPVVPVHAKTLVE